MRQVSVLMDNEQRKDPFLTSLGMSIQPKYMCRVVTPTQLFTFQVNSLMTKDIKLMNYLKTQQGIIISIEWNHKKTEYLARIRDVMKEMLKVPFLIIVYNVRKNQEEHPQFVWLQKICHHRGIRKLWKVNADYADYADDYLSWFNQEVVKVAERKSKMTSLNISDQNLMNQFETTTLPMQLWDHYGRLRLVDISLRKYGYSNTINQNGWLMKHWKAYKTSIDHGHLWHYSLTRFWIEILYHLQQTGQYSNFDKLYSANPMIHRGKLFLEYYTPEVIFGQLARETWILPNLKALI